jgi:hypothetical protein
MAAVHTPKGLRTLRDHEITDLQSAVAWALQMKPGVVVVNGGRKRAEAQVLSGVYSRHLAKMRKRDGRAKLGRYTSPKPKAAPVEVPE